MSKGLILKIILCGFVVFLLLPAVFDEEQAKPVKNSCAARLCDSACLTSLSHPRSRFVPSTATSRGVMTSARFVMRN